MISIDLNHNIEWQSEKIDSSRDQAKEIVRYIPDIKTDSSQENIEFQHSTTIFNNDIPVMYEKIEQQELSAPRSYFYMVGNNFPSIHFDNNFRHRRSRHFPSSNINDDPRKYKIHVSSSKYLYAKKDPYQIRAGFFWVRRKQIGGNIALNLNTDFKFIVPFTRNRFAPDEPSSFSYLLLTFGDYNPNLNLSAGFFRNHVKGDFILGNSNDIHFGVGNSQVGLGVGFEASTTLYKSSTASLSLFIGFGPQLSKFTSGSNIVTPGKREIKGYGEVALIGASITTPKYGKIFSVSFRFNALFHYASFKKFSVTSRILGATSSYTHINFLTASFSPSIQLNFSLSRRR